MAYSLVQPSLAGGEISPSLYGRIDLEKYQTSLRRCRNFIVRQSGGIENRPGFRFLGSAKYADRYCRLIPFQFSVSQTYALELGDHYFRVWSNGALVTDGGSPVEVATPWPVSVISELKFTQSADVMTVCHNDYPPLEIRRYGEADWRTAAVTTTSGPFQDLNTDDSVTVYASGRTGSVTLTASSPIFKSQHVGKLFYMEQKAVDSVGRWETDKDIGIGDECRYQENFYRCVDGGSNGTTGTVAPTHTTGDSWDGWGLGGRNGVLWRYLHSGFGVCRITAVAGDGLTATADVVPRQDGEIELPAQVVGSTFATYKWAHYAWNDTDGYPGTVTYYQQRLIFGGSRAFPQTIWCSRTGDYHNFYRSNPKVDDDAITYNYAGRQLNKILHLLDVGQLIVLTSGGEFKVTGDSNGNLTGTGGFAMSGQSFNGSSDLAPINVGSVALYVQQKGSIIRDLFYSFDQDSYQSSDLTLLASHLFNGYSIRDWALSVQPFSVAWCARSDGMLLGLTYLREQQVYAWHPHPMTNGYVESICSISEGQEDAVYALIRRTVNGSTVRYVERLNTRQFTEQQDAFFVDSGLSYSGENTDSSRTMTISSAGGWTYQDEFTLTCSSAIFDSSSTDYEIHIPYTEGGVSKSMRLSIAGVISSTVATVLANRDVPTALRNTAQSTWSIARRTFAGLSHLEGQTVSILADGNVEPQQVVSGGEVTIENHSSVVHIGLPVAAVIETLDVNVAGQSTLLDKTKLINQLCVMLNSGRSVWAGTDDAHLLEYTQREWEFYDDPVGLKTGIIDMNLDANWERNGRVVISHSDPLPLGILAIIPRVTVGG
ncbi:MULTISPECIES: hypothetical protein [Klebsiella]|uniref:hypothetical protein n=1 Tax=Klebsiella pneumoniae complex TaxID=3390273 RepID=UPI000C7B4913|nr:MULTISPECIES: hypothetical protein [Klebsiella]MCI8123327.1 hypothetical protein [Klebsiella pneumoniae]MCI8130283.1 hypothetical protein [Klebsiella pneumoniae]MCM1594586.1 hypothetical protein [Klebsiella pneumoniae]PLC73915.1 hypothetical protein B6I39_03610 [Klebsiella quasipneumoniae]SWB09670.1 Uncharacterised protein [Klebsiella pneumoniae]